MNTCTITAETLVTCEVCESCGHLETDNKALAASSREMPLREAVERIDTVKRGGYRVWYRLRVIATGEAVPLLAARRFLSLAIRP